MIKLTDEMRKQIRAQLVAPRRPSKNPARRREIHGYRYNGGKPFYSDALGVNPDQVKKANEELRRHGCTATYMPDGTLETTSEKQFHEVAKIAGLRTGQGYRGGVDEEGRDIHTGRELERKKQEFRQKVLNGEIELG